MRDRASRWYTRSGSAARRGAWRRAAREAQGCGSLSSWEKNVIRVTLWLAHRQSAYSREFLDVQNAAGDRVQAVSHDHASARVRDELYVPEDSSVLLVDLHGDHAAAPAKVVHRDTLSGVPVHANARAKLGGDARDAGGQTRAIDARRTVARDFSVGDAHLGLCFRPLGQCQQGKCKNDSCSHIYESVASITCMIGARVR